MQRRLSVSFIVVFTMIVSLAFVACSSSGDSSTGGTVSSAPAAPAAPAAAAPATGDTSAPSAPIAAAAPAQSVIQAPAAAPVATTTTATSGLPRQSVNAKVDRVVLSVEAPTQPSNDLRLTCCFDIMQLKPMYENLIALTEGGKYIPNLAESWTVEDGGTAVRFKLRKGVQFQGGWGEFTASDLKWKYSHLVDFEGSHRHRADWLSWVGDADNIEIINDYEVLYHINPAANFLVGFSDRWSQMPAVSEKHFNEVGNPTTLEDMPLAGTGPYQFVQHIQESFIRFERVPYDHWRVNPDFKEFEFRFISEASTRFAALLADEVHITKLGPDLTNQAKGKGFGVVENTVKGPRVYGNYYCCWSTKDPDTNYKTYTGEWPYNPSSALADPKVRQALNKFINRAELTAAFSPDSEPMYLENWHPTYPGWDPRFEREFSDKYGYDPAAATALLAEAGYGPNNPLEVNLILATILNISQPFDVAEGMAGYWRDNGVKVNLLSPDSTTRRANARNRVYDDHIQVAGSATYQVFGIELHLSNLLTASSAGFNTPETNAKLTEIRKLISPTDQDPLLRELGNTFYDAFPSIPLWYIPLQAIYNSDIVSTWEFAGAEHGAWNHVEDIRAVVK